MTRSPPPHTRTSAPRAPNENPGCVWRGQRPDPPPDAHDAHTRTTPATQGAQGQNDLFAACELALSPMPLAPDRADDPRAVSAPDPLPASLPNDTQT